MSPQLPTCAPLERHGARQANKKKQKTMNEATATSRDQTHVAELKWLPPTPRYIQRTCRPLSQPFSGFSDFFCCSLETFCDSDVKPRIAPSVQFRNKSCGYKAGKNTCFVFQMLWLKGLFCSYLQWLWQPTWYFYLLRAPLWNIK